MKTRALPLFHRSTVTRVWFRSLRRLTSGFVLFVSVLSVSKAGSLQFEWADTGTLAQARESHTGTLLLNGQVLVTGGLGHKGFSNPVLDSAELYDPLSSTWRLTGRLAAARTQHTATRLLDGKVLMVGGISSNLSTRLSSAELYDPESGQFTFAGRMHARRSSHLAVELLDGRVLVAGGYDGSTALTSAEIYDPATGTWTVTGNLNLTRAAPVGVVLQSGQVLIMGGSADYQSAELYDPATGAWTFTGNMIEIRIPAYTATLLEDGKVLVAGGNANSGVHKSCELYDPATGSWSETGELGIARGGHQAVLLPDGSVLVEGGQADGPHGILYPRLTEIYHPGLGLWTGCGQLLVGRFAHSSNLLPDGRVLVAGGLSNQGPGLIRRCELGTQVTSSGD